MDTKALAFGIVGFLLGGLVVSIAAQIEDDSEHSAPGPAVTGTVSSRSA